MKLNIQLLLYKVYQKISNDARTVNLCFQTCAKYHIQLFESEREWARL